MSYHGTMVLNREPLHTTFEYWQAPWCAGATNRLSDAGPLKLKRVDQDVALRGGSHPGPYVRGHCRSPMWSSPRVGVGLLSTAFYPVQHTRDSRRKRANLSIRTL
jgi:hypothetical protein